MLEKMDQENLQELLEQAKDKLLRVSGRCPECERRVRNWIMMLKQEINRRNNDVLRRRGKDTITTSSATASTCGR